MYRADIIYATIIRKILLGVGGGKEQKAIYMRDTMQEASYSYSECSYNILPCIYI